MGSQRFTWPPWFGAGPCASLSVPVTCVCPGTSAPFRRVHSRAAVTPTWSFWGRVCLGGVGGRPAVSRRLGGVRGASVSAAWGGAALRPQLFVSSVSPLVLLCLLLASLSVSAPRSVKKKIVGNSTRIALNLSNNLGTVDVLLILIISPRTRGILPFVQVCFCVDSPFRDV